MYRIAGIFRGYKCSRFDSYSSKFIYALWSDVFILLCRLWNISFFANFLFRTAYDLFSWSPILILIFLGVCSIFDEEGVGQCDPLGIGESSICFEKTQERSHRYELENLSQTHLWLSSHLVVKKSFGGFRHFGDYHSVSCHEELADDSLTVAHLERAVVDSSHLDVVADRHFHECCWTSYLPRNRLS